MQVESWIRRVFDVFTVFNVVCSWEAGDRLKVCSADAFFLLTWRAARHVRRTTDRSPIVDELENTLRQSRGG